MANGPSISLQKLVDKIYADVNDILMYTLVINNSGDTAANNMILLDTIPKGTTYVNNSLTLNGVIQSGASPAPPIGAAVGSLNSAKTTTITFKVQVATIPSPNVVTNDSTLTYNYTVSGTTVVSSGSAYSLSTNTIINSADIDVVKAVDKVSAKIGDPLTYTIQLSNTGNILSTNVRIQDTIPSGTKFVENSVMVNGVTQPGVTPNPGSGVLISSINPNETYTVSFVVDVISIPTVNPIPNSSVVSYDYSVNALTGEVITKKKNSNTVYTMVRQAIIDGTGFVKSVDKPYATVGDTLNYTLNMHNSGNAAALNVVVSDTIPEGASFVENSVTLNGITQTGANPNLGVSVGTIDAGKSSSMRFKVLVVTPPFTNKVLNSATAQYEFYLVPTVPRGESGSGNSNIVATTINYATVVIGKSVNKTTANDDDTLTYTLELRNNGNIPVYDVVVFDSIPNNTQIVPGSITVNGSSVAGGNMGTGVTVPVINPNALVVVQFKALIISIPSSGLIKNTSRAKYSYKVNPSDPTITNTAKSNEVIVSVYGVEFDDKNFVKSVDKSFAAIGDTLAYTLFIRNGGNISATNVMFYDTIPAGSSFVKDTFAVNGKVFPGDDPNKGVNIGEITPQGSLTVTFTALVDTIPSPNAMVNEGILIYLPQFATISESALSNAVVVTVNSPFISMKKDSNVHDVNVNDMVTYKILISNSGNVPVTDFVVRDMLPADLLFEKGSVHINGATVAGNIINGIKIGTIPQSSVTTVTFNAKVVERPDSGVIKNYATGDYCYKVNPDQPSQRGSIKSNENEVIVDIVEVTMVKESSVKEAVIGSDFTYTVTIENTGEINVTDFVFKDKLPKEVELVPNSVVVNGKSINGIDPAVGIRIGTINVDDKVVISFKVKAKGSAMCCKMINYAEGQYHYRLSANRELKVGYSKSNEVEVKIPNASFKQLSISQLYNLDEGTCISEVDNVIPTIEITGYQIVRTPSGTSEGNRTITGNKIVVNGVINYMVEYTSCNPEEAVYVEYLTKSFSTYVVLPAEYERGRTIKVNTVIEDLDYTVLNEQTLIIGIVFLLNVAIL